MGHHQKRPGQNPIQSERNSLGRPQVFVQLAFGLSWSDRHIPRSHTFSYTSKNLKEARESGHFPRQVPPVNTKFFADPESRPHRGQDSSQRQPRGERHHRDEEHPRGRPSNPRPVRAGQLSPPRESRSDGRRATHERGSSAPPLNHDSSWDDEAGTSATLFPGPTRATRIPPQARKNQPANPAQFRLGEDGLPWSAWAWPFDPDGDENEPAFINHPITVPLSPPNRRRSEDPQRVQELESLSTALMTVDNGFENQWWYQGERESTAFFAPKTIEDDARPMSVADAVLLSAAEPPSGVDTYSPNTEESFRGLVSPLSDVSPSFNLPGPLQRSFSTRSEELWMER
ncbi:hypothetical protein F5Y19DRAFT_168765 [Xylariaceae sp. FL1651]|nr:hypothetical protein F5Y19DRAFT_168765 [Xylariaceae sp. FL1651]